MGNPVVDYRGCGNCATMRNMLPFGIYQDTGCFGVISLHDERQYYVLSSILIAAKRESYLVAIVKTDRFKEFSSI